MDVLIGIGYLVVMVLIFGFLLLFARVVLIPTLILSAIGAFLGYLIDNAIGTGTCFATVGSIIGGVIGAVGGFKVLGGGG